MKKTIYVISLLSGMLSGSVFSGQFHEVSSTNGLNSRLQLAAEQGARCSDGTFCEVGYNACCYVNGVEGCYKSLSDCVDN